MAVRVDKWLWAVRVYKTRSQANDACSAGRVRVNDEVAKPATKIAIGDVVETRRKERTIIYQVVQPLEKRVSAVLAKEAVEDLSPPAEKSDVLDPMFAPPLYAKRERGAGRPTKRDRRELDRIRERVSKDFDS